MKKKIGFIDLHIDEWHANNYQSWFNVADRVGEFEISYAWENSPNPNGLPLEQWCAAHNITPLSSAEELVEKSDCICVLAPSNPEWHERLAELPLKSGKPLYIDKPFAPSKETAIRFFDLAKKYKTPLSSSSALRYAAELLDAKASLANQHIDMVVTNAGGRNFPEYAIHPLEIIVSLMGVGVKRIMRSNTQKDAIAVNIQYTDGRIAIISYNTRSGYAVNILSDAKTITYPTLSRFFENMVNAQLDFFTTGIPMVPQEETIEIAAILEAAVKAENTPDVWVNL